MNKEITEKWKDVTGYEGIYKVSNLGNVKSLDRIATYSNQKDRLLNGRVLKKGINSVGYYIVGLHKNRIQTTKQVHQLVAESFLGHKTCGYQLVVHHVNESKLDNRAENLEIITHRKNVSITSKKRTSKYAGVHFRKDTKKWNARVYLNGKSKSLGCHLNEFDAHMAYQNALIKYNL